MLDRQIRCCYALYAFCSAREAHDVPHRPPAIDPPWRHVKDAPHVLPCILEGFGRKVSNPPTTARRECCLYSAALLLRSAAQLLSLSTVNVVVSLGATAQDPPRKRHVYLFYVFYRFISGHQNLPLVWTTAPLSQTHAHTLARCLKWTMRTPLLP